MAQPGKKKKKNHLELALVKLPYRKSIIHLKYSISILSFKGFIHT